MMPRSQKPRSNWLRGQVAGIVLVAFLSPGSFPASWGQVSDQAVQPISLQVAQPTDNRKTAYEITVTADGWQETSVSLRVGDRIQFHAAGSMILSDGRSVQPSGSARDWRDMLRIYPLSSANAGALIGRIGSGDAALPFPIGENGTLTVPAAGKLYLRTNLSPDLTSHGSYTVKVELHPAEPGSTAMVLQESQRFSALLSPTLFADIPRRVGDQQGNPGDMVNFALNGSRQQVRSDLEKAGWFPTDATPKDALVNGLLQTLQRKSYMAIPMSTLFLFGRPQDMAYARANAIEVAAERHHLRLWKTEKTIDGQPLWVGSSTYDNGFATDQRTGGVTHSIDPDIDKERDYILSSLKNAGVVRAAAYVLPSDPVRSAHTATGGSFQSDGRIVVILLR